jgi:zinc transport system substrate-binding protein
MKINKPAALLVFAVFASALLGAEGVEEVQPKIMATTSWTAAFVRAAGYEDAIHVLAPYELRHPPEYELKPSDIAAVSEAEIIVFAGYEGMVSRIKEAVENTEAQMVRITTDYSLPVLEESISKLGDVLGTEAAAGKNVAELRDFYSSWKEEIAGGGDAAAEVICHFFQRPLAEELGFTVIGVFGPAPLEASELNKLAGNEPDFIIDNWHNDVGKPLLEVMPDVPAAVLINFPGHAGTERLIDVLKYNRKELGRVLRY